MAAHASWFEEAAAFIERHASFRRFVIILSSIAAPAFLAALALPDKIHVSSDWAFGAVVAITIIAVALGFILTLTERSSGDLLSTIAREQADSARKDERIRAMETELRKSAKENERLAGLAALQDGLLIVTNFVFELLYQGEPAQQDSAIFALLQEIGAVGARVFGWTATERWSLAIYIWDDEAKELQCKGDIRNLSSDHGEGHRSWKHNQGMVGVTFAFGEELVVSDARSSELQTIMRDPDDARAEDDRDLYRSVAAVPIFRPATDLESNDGSVSFDGLFGVVVATSDQGSRFTPDGDNELAPLRSIADAIETLLIGGCFDKAKD